MYILFVNMNLALNIADVRKQLPELSKYLVKNGTVIVTNHGRPESILVGYNNFYRIINLNSRSSMHCAVILAASGNKRRTRLIINAKRLIRILNRLHIGQIILICDFQKITKFSGLPENTTIMPVTNNNPGFASSLKRALRFIEGNFDSVLITFATRPNIKLSTIQALFTYFETTAKKPAIVSPIYKSRRGHPVLLSANIIPELLSMDSRWGLASFIRHHSKDCVDIEVKDQGVVKVK
ncbi:MAG: hypothetical protein COS94_00190 [Candidatus Hydrogenedentes bacterium CG07_land_8_20_14_0_80_42_17]|nr:MAG: hypothetical protein AUJ18_00495 [Candidatus Hydrogenedentes bacterium CG1_02_42_14]PIU48829.1 MAG: hypothetical protein COS94_00190 [Candidatus Hydrogenedentes bacterium CG07_land_8_20_14_0_80_42_17]